MPRLTMILDKIQRDEHLIDYEIISINPNNICPIRWITSKQEYPIGALVDIGITSGTILNKLLKYQDHDYEYATVLGYNSTDKLLEVFGSKIGEENVRISDSLNLNIRYSHYDFYTPGTFLLLKKVCDKPFDKLYILHNITKERLKKPIHDFAKRAK